ncbi:MAG: TonB-dependent receptor domain-containing protein [Rhodothermales bacterium]
MCQIRRYAVVFLAGWLCLAGLGVSSASAQVQADSAQVQTPPYTFDFRGTLLTDALQRLLEATRIELVYDPALVSGKESRCTIRRAGLEDVLRCLLARSGLAFQRLPSGAYVIKEAPADTTRQARRARQQATPRYTISGFLEDAESGEKLIGANLYAVLRHAGTATNAYGFYSLTLPTDSVTLRVSYLGYETLTYRLLLDKDLRLDIRLQPVTLMSEGIEVVADRLEPIEERTRMSTIDVPVRHIKAVPTILGEVDVLRTLQLLPGVQSGTEGTSGLFVRGGSPDQTLILLDGAPVYNASHLGGFFSVFNADAIKHVEIIKGGFPARYGGRLSSVLDIGMKEGNMREFVGAGAIGFVASRLMIEGPIKKETTSFIISGRRTYLDAIMRPFMPKDERGGFFFYDLNAKVNHLLSPTDRVYFSVYRGLDRFSALERRDNFRNKAFLQWGNLTSTIRWNHLWSNKLFSNVTATYSRFRFEVGSEQKGSNVDEAFKLLYQSGIRDWGVKVDFDYRPDPDHYIRFGLNGLFHTFRPGATQIKVNLDDSGEASPVTIEPAEPLDALEYAAFVEDDIKVNDRLKVNVGLHASGFLITNRHFSSLQPRVSLRYLLPNGWALKASYASMKQYILLLTNSSVGLPTDLWLPATRRVPPQSSHLVAAGLARTVLNNQFEVSLEGYYKAMTNLIEFKGGSNFLGLDENWQDKVESGKGHAYGAELFVQKKAGRTTGWLSYTLSWSNRRFDNLNGGRIFPFKYDRRHNIALVLIHHVSPRTEISGSWVYLSGSALTLPTTVYYVHPYVDADACFGCTIESYGQRNDFRMRARHRLDVGIHFHKPTRSGERTISLGLYNAYNRRNPFFVTLDEKEEKLHQFSLFPAIPYITYRRTF